MSRYADYPATIRRYLLSQLTDDAQQEIEQRLLTEDELLEELEIAEDELIDEYLAGRLSREERDSFEQHFLVTPERTKKLRFAQTLNNYISTQPGPQPVVIPIKRTAQPWWRPPVFNSPWAVAAMVLLVVGLGATVWRGYFYQSEVDKGLVALNAAYRDQRPLEARISSLPYAPFATTRGPEGERVNKTDLQRAELTLLEALQNKPTPDVRHALGEVYLAKKQFDEAIKQFQEALKGDPNNPKLHSDLGTALLEKGRADRLGNSAGKGQAELAESLKHLNKALELEASLPEALFNRALLYQELALPEDAKEDWKKYLEKDPNSKWAEDAKQRLDLLEGQKTSATKEELLQDFLAAYQAGDDERAFRVISKSREPLSRKLIWEQLLDGYLEAANSGRPQDAERQLQALAYEGELESRKIDDQLVSDLASYYRVTTEQQRPRLAQARDSMKLGHQYYFQHKLPAAVESYSKALDIFTSLKDECEAQYAQQWIAYMDYEQGKTQQAVSQLERLAEEFRKENYQWLLMRTLYLASSGYHNMNEYSKAISYNLQALALAQQIEDLIGIFNSSSILTFQYSSTGNHQEALAYVQEGLSVMPSCPLNELQRARQYTIVSDAFGAASYYDAAIAYQKEGLRRAVAMSHVQHISLDYARLGLMYAKTGNFDEAFRNLELSYTTGQSFPEEKSRKEMMAFSALRTGHLYRERGDFSQAITNYNQSIALGDLFHFKYDIYEAHKDRLFCYLALGDDASARDELKQTLDLAEKYRSTILEGENRNSFFDIQQSVYDLAIDFAYSRLKDPQQAFQYSEDSRARSLLDSVTGHADISTDKRISDLAFASVAEPLTRAEIQKRLPANAQLIQYAVLNDKTLIWVISKDGFSILEEKISQRELENRVTEYLQAVGAATPQTEEVRNHAEGLFDTLVKPAEPLLDKSKSVYLVLDKSLNLLPFGTLISTATGRFLLEDYRLEVSPSASLLVFLSELAGKKEGPRNERVLSVGNPRFDRNDFPSLADLPAAGREAEEVAACYNSARVLLGANATHQQVSREMSKSDIVHFALHSIAVERSPMHSRLVLAKDAKLATGDRTTDGSLEAYEIYQLKLPQTRLAVLSACQTGAGRYYAGEGMISLARPFLAAGVPLVVVSLWPVDSDSTAELMISFHKHRKRDNVSSAEALRQAQLDMLHGSDERFHNAAFWGAFVLIGGFARF